jgi:hypothetical protein
MKTHPIPNPPIPKTPKDHAQLKNLVFDLKLDVRLDEPPNIYIAVITQKNTSKTNCIQFNSHEDMDAVLKRLIETQLETTYKYVELTNSTLNYFIEQEKEKGKTTFFINGSQVRYSPKKEWSKFSDDISIRIFEDTPFQMTDHAPTLEININKIKAAIETELEKIHTRKEKLEQAKENL